MKRIFKKAVAFLLLLTMLCSVTACGDPKSANPTEDGVVSLAELSSFTIVYPASYTDQELEELRLLQNVIHHHTQVYVPVVPDTEAPAANEIILASSSRQTGVSDTVKAFASDLDYLVAVDGNNIVLGGKGFYANMRAIYDFINNYLGYDDLENVYAQTPASEIKESKTVLYTEPAFTISVLNDGARPFTSAKDVKVMADAGFNMVRLDVSRFKPELYKDYAKWCARFNVRILQRAVYSIKNRDFFVNDLEYSINNPIIYGHWAKYDASINDIETYNDMCAAYQEKYEQYGWKLVMTAPAQKSEYIEQYVSSEEGRDQITYEKDEDGNYILDEDGNKIPIPPAENTREKNIFNGAAILNASIEFNAGLPSVSRDEDRPNQLNKFMQIAQRNDRDLWVSIASASIDGRISALKWQAYIALAYNVTGIEYDTYRGLVVNNNFTTTSNYDTIKQINNEILMVAEKYLQYDFVGVTIYNTSEYSNDAYAVMEDGMTDYESFAKLTPYNTEDPHLLAVFKNNEGKYAAIIVDLAEVEQNPAASPNSSIKLGDGSALAYIRDGAVVDSTAKGDAWAVKVLNGSGVFVYTK